ncbi:MAG: VanZ family protein [Thermoanaerobaculia bacterium]
MRTFLTHHLPALLWTIVVGVVLALPGGTFASLTRRVPDWAESWADKGVHALLFLVLAALLLNSAGAIASIRRPVAAVLAGSLAYALLLELLQTQVSGRGLDPMDFVAGGVGALVGLAVASIRGSTSPP